MEWYYARGGQQHGPVSEVELEALVRSGQIADATLVWRPGLVNWQSYGALRAGGAPPPILSASPSGVCSVCLQAFPPDGLVELLGKQVCAACKPAVVQGLREGVMVGGGGGLWRQGPRLVMTREASLPHRCVKCNAPTTGPLLKRSLSWHHPAYFLIALVALLIYVIVAMIVNKRAKIEIGLCPGHRQLRGIFIGVAWAGVLAGIAGIVYGFANESLLGFVGLLALLVGVVVGNFGARVVYATRIDDRHLWIKGFCRDYLQDLPEWPGK